MAVAFDLLYKLARRSGLLVEGDQYAAGSGSTTTVVSTALTAAANTLVGGTVFITRDAGGAGAAPEKQSRQITTYAVGTITVLTAFTAAVAAGDKFAYITARFSRGNLLAALNAAMKWYGPIPQEDESLTTAADTQQYALPTGFPEAMLAQVEIATQLASEYDYVPFSHWQVDLEARKLVFDYQPTVGYKIKLRYSAYQADVDSDDDTVSDLYDADTLVEYAFWYLRLVRIERQANPSKVDEAKMNLALQMAEKMKAEHPLPVVRKQPRRMWWGEGQTNRLSFLPNHRGLR